MEKYFEINEEGHNIRCKLYCEKGHDIKKLVLFLHGFAGHKDNKTAAKFAERLLSKYKGAALASFDWPCHGDDVKKTLQLSDCSVYLRIVSSYLKKTFRPEKLFVYAVSFGGYMVLKYINDNENPFDKIALRSPAVNIYESITGDIMTADDHEKLAKGKKVTVGFDRKVDMNLKFLNDLKNADIRQMNFINYADDIIIIHGTKDELIPFSESKALAENNVIDFIPIDGADHRFQNPDHVEMVTKELLRFYGM